MDTSDEYLKMCLQSTEIQEFWKDINFRKVGCVYHVKHQTSCQTFINKRSTVDKMLMKNYETYWVPRQDELQEFLYISRIDKEGYEFGMLDLWKSFETFINYDYPDERFMNTINYFDTFEQAWLLFYMLKKHNKIWTKQDWEVVKSGSGN